MSTIYSLRLGLKVLLKVYVCTRYRSCPGGKGVCEWLIWEVTPASVTRVMGRGEGEGKEASKACASRQIILWAAEVHPCWGPLGGGRV